VEDDFASIFQAELDDVAFAQVFAIHFLAVNEDALAVTEIFKAVAGFPGDDGDAAAGYAAVVELQVIAGFAAPADEERRLGDGDELVRPAGEGDLEHGLLVRGIFGHSSQGNEPAK
jgi:hypothetical protein